MYLTDLFIFALTMRTGPLNDQYRTLIRDAKNYITQNFWQQRFSLNMMAIYRCHSPAISAPSFKRETGQSFVEYLTKSQVDKACGLLKYTQRWNWRRLGSGWGAMIRTISAPRLEDNGPVAQGSSKEVKISWRQQSRWQRSSPYSQPETAAGNRYEGGEEKGLRKLTCIWNCALTLLLFVIAMISWPEWFWGSWGMIRRLFQFL